MSEDLFGGALPEPPRPPKAQFHGLVVWSRLDRIKRPECMHCQMLAHFGDPLDVLKARWIRTGREGSTLELCDPHTEDQKERDAQEAKESLWQKRWKTLAGAIVDTMDDPDSWDDGEGDETGLLIDYVQHLALKIDDINRVLDRDMRTRGES